MAENQHASKPDSSQGLKNGLKSRHLTMISIAGVIGGALFVGSGNVIYSAGPAALIAYTLGGLLVLFIMRMLGEMATSSPDTGSFSTYADRAIGRWAGFTIGWVEGIEINLLGLVAGIDVRSPALKLPGWGRVGV